MNNKDFRAGQTVRYDNPDAESFTAYISELSEVDITFVDTVSGDTWTLDRRLLDYQGFTIVKGRIGRRVINEYRESNPKIDIYEHTGPNRYNYLRSTNYYSHVSDAVAATYKDLPLARHLVGRIDKTKH